MTLSAGVESKKKPGVSSSCSRSATGAAVILVTETVESCLKVAKRGFSSSIDPLEITYTSK